ncbi:MAG: hypothetical protein H6822_13980 [Planctomycetaceae bacterium]|nr:hypothetical protein [Planctomycetales bacterium]MCB9923287.1 hypothetical protein [Planctomycetaceae bacterium]
MRLVLDTNQVSKLVHAPSVGGRPNVVIPPLVWAEILLAPACHHKERIRAIVECNVVFGMDVPDVYQRLCGLTEEEIRQFDPVFATDSDEHHRLVASFSAPRDALLARARELKQGAAEGAKHLSDRLAHYRREDHIAKSKREERNYERKFTDIDDADERFVSGDSAPFRTRFVQDVTDGGSRSIRASSKQSFYNAVLQNSQFRRFLQLIITFDLSYANHWADDCLNRLDPSENRNDFTDMTLPLYARDGDTVLTNDGFLRKAIRHVDPNGNVSLSTWDETLSRNA